MSNIFYHLNFYVLGETCNRTYDHYYADKEEALKALEDLFKQYYPCSGILIKEEKTGPNSYQAEILESRF